MARSLRACGGVIRSTRSTCVGEATVKVKLTQRELLDLLEIEPTVLSKYVSPLLNLANQYAQGTRPSVVGQMSELIQEFPGRTLDEWRTWYLERYPNGIEDATSRIYNMINKFRKALDTVDKATVARWVEYLIIVQTFVGLRFQEAIGFVENLVGACSVHIPWRKWGQEPPDSSLTLRMTPAEVSC